MKRLNKYVDFEEIRNYFFEPVYIKPIHFFVAATLFFGVVLGGSYLGIYEMNNSRREQQLIEKRILDMKKEYLREYLEQRKRELRRLKKEKEGVVS